MLVFLALEQHRRRSTSSRRRRPMMSRCFCLLTFLSTWTAAVTAVTATLNLAWISNRFRTRGGRFTAAILLRPVWFATPQTATPTISSPLLQNVATTATITPERSSSIASHSTVTETETETTPSSVPVSVSSLTLLVSPSSVPTNNQNHDQNQNQKKKYQIDVQGDENNCDDDDDPEKRTIRNFLEKEGEAQSRRRGSDMANSSSLLPRFHIHGWRWHTHSLIRDAGRLHHLAAVTVAGSGSAAPAEPNTTTATAAATIPPPHVRVQHATEYVINFNMKGLHKIEGPLFFPWMRDKLTASSTFAFASSVTAPSLLVSAFGSILDQLETEQRMVAKLGRTLRVNSDVVGSTTIDAARRAQALRNIVRDSSQLQQHAQRMRDLEETYLVPALALVVPEQEQKAFNTKVLRQLGLFESRVHLVGMYETIHATTQKDDEYALFQQAIPALSRKMIPRWKRKLYDPKTYML